MTTYIGAAEAARRLGVSRPTLYAYVSRGTISRRTAVDGRTSLFALDEVEALATRSRRRAVEPPPSIDVHVVSGVTTLDDERLAYRGHDVAQLATSSTFEQVAELLWTGTLPPLPPAWERPERDDVDALRGVIALLGTTDGPRGVGVAAAVLDRVHGDDDPVTAARRTIQLAPLAFGAPRKGPAATRLAAALHRSPSDELVGAIDRALVLLADHELSTSTLAVRVAGSVRASSYQSFVAGAAVFTGRLHGSAGALCRDLLDEAADRGVVPTIARRLEAREHLPGFGHAVYRNDDPRFAVLLDAVRRLPDPSRVELVEQVLIEAGRRIGRRPNVDLALGALSFAGGLPRDLPVFAVARVAGWGAHLAEELGERPLRYRGLARSPR